MREGGRSSNAIAIVLLALGFVGLCYAYFNSYRLGLINSDLAFAANFDRMVAGAAVGVAAAVIGALHPVASKIQNHVLGFVLVSSFSAVMLLGVYFELPTALVFLVAAGSLPIVYKLTALLRSTTSASVYIPLLLTLSFLLSIVSFIGASMAGGIVGGLIFWLQGDLSSVGGYAPFSLIICLSLLVWLIKDKSNEVPLLLLLGIGLAIAGPLFFVGCLVPLLVKRFVEEASYSLFLLTSTGMGAFAVVLADAVPRLLLGGYAPALIVPVALVSIPIILMLQNSVDSGSAISTVINRLFGALWMVAFVFILFHVVIYARMLT